MSPASKKAVTDEGEDPAVSGATASGERQGRVAFVGVGPGDPELLTLRAVRILGTADAIVVHETMAPLFSAHFNPAAEVIGPAGASRGWARPYSATLLSR